MNPCIALAILRPDMKDEYKISIGIITFLGLAATAVNLMHGQHGQIFAICILSIGLILLSLLVFSCLLMAKNKEDGIDDELS